MKTRGKVILGVVLAIAAILGYFATKYIVDCIELEDYIDEDEDEYSNNNFEDEDFCGKF